MFNFILQLFRQYTPIPCLLFQASHNQKSSTNFFLFKWYLTQNSVFEDSFGNRHISLRAVCSIGPALPFFDPPRPIALKCTSRMTTNEGISNSRQQFKCNLSCVNRHSCAVFLHFSQAALWWLGGSDSDPTGH
jgi:hypothetical protein